MYTSVKCQNHMWIFQRWEVMYARSWYCRIMVDFLNSIGKRVRILRNDLRMEQKEVAALASVYGVQVSQATISRIERDVIEPNAVTIAALARALGTTTDYLLMLSDDPVPPGEDEAEPVKALRDGPARYEVSELLSLLNAMPAEDVDHLLYVARLMRDARAPRIVG